MFSNSDVPKNCKKNYYPYSPRRYLYFDVVVGLVWSNDPESYAGGSIATDRASHAGQVEGDVSDKKGNTGPPGWDRCNQARSLFIRKLLIA